MFAVFPILLATVLSLALTLAGTKIENIASARYRNDDGNNVTVFSEKVITTVMPVYGFTIKPDGTFDNPGQEVDGVLGTVVDTFFTVTNHGNSPTTISLEAFQISEDELLEAMYSLSYDSSRRPVLKLSGIYLDKNENGIIDSDEPPMEVIDLQVNGYAKIIVRFIVEEIGEETDLCFVNVRGTDPAGNIDEDNIARINVRKEEMLTVEKSLSFEEVSPGMIQEFTIDITNNYAFEIDFITVAEYIDFNGISIDGIVDTNSITSNTRFTIRFFDGNNWSETRPEKSSAIKGFEMMFLNVLPAETINVRFDVFFPASAKPGIRYNTAYLTYYGFDESQEVETNTVDFSITALENPFIGPEGYPEAPEMTAEDTTVSTLTVYSGQKVSFVHTLKNSGNISGIMDLLVGSANFDLGGWSFRFLDVSGTPLEDSDNSGNVDVGEVSPGEEIDVILEVTVAQDVTGDNNGKTFKFIPETHMGEKINRTIDIIPLIKGADSIDIEKVLLSGSLVLPGEEMRYSISISNNIDQHSGRIVVKDKISEMLSEPYEIEVTREASVSFQSKERILEIELESLDPLETVTIFFKCRSAEDLPEGVLIENSASVEGVGGQAESKTVSAKIYHGKLELIKTVSPSVVELGSELTYRIEVTNPSSIATVTNLVLEDNIPPGTSYIKGTSTIDGLPFEPEVIGGRLLFSDLEDLGPGEKTVLIYRLILEEFTGESLQNRVTVTGSILSGEFIAEVETEPAYADVAVFRPMNRGSGIVGRVYVDINENGFYDSEDVAPIPIRLILEDGSFVVTDEEGLFHFEKLRPGLHSMKIDIDVSSYDLSPLQDSRSLRNARSFMIDLMPGMYSIIDIPLVRRESLEESIIMKDSSILVGLGGKSAIVSAIISDNFVDSTVDGYIFSPIAGQEFIGADRISVEIAVPAESSFSLYINGILIPESQVGQRATDKLQEWLFAKYFNVKLLPGTNNLRIEWFDRNDRGSHEIQVYLSGEPQRIEIVTVPRVLIADGITEALLKISLVDEKGVPSSVGGTLIIEGLGSHEVSERDGRWDGKGLIIEDGIATLRLKPRSNADVLEFTVKYAGLSADARLEFIVEERPPLVTGSANVKYNLSSGKISVEGGLFGRLNIGQSLLTFRIGEEATGNFDSYITHGDGSTSGTLASSSEWLFFRFEKGLFNVQLGDYNFDELIGIGFSSRGTGLSSEYYGESLSYKLFANPVFGELKKEEFRGEGIRGPYYLEGSPILNSETVTILTRNENGEVVKRKLMRRNQDYILYASGMIIFTNPVPYFDIDFNPISIDVEYSVESSVPGDVDIMGQVKYKQHSWEYDLAGIMKGFSSGYRFGSFKASGPLSESVASALMIQLSSNEGEVGFRTVASAQLGIDMLAGKLEVHFEGNFTKPGNLGASSGFGLDLELNPRFLGIKILSGYSYSEKTEQGTLSLELLKDFTIGNILLESSLKETLIHRGGELTNEIKVSLKPTFSSRDFKIRGEISTGLRNLDPFLGLKLGADFGLSETLFAGGDIVFDYTGSGKTELSLTPYVLKRLGKVSLTIRERVEILPEPQFSTILGFGLSLDTGKVDMEATISDKVSIGAGYTGAFSPDVVNVELLLQGSHTFGGTSSENFYSVHFAVENREVKDLKLRFDADLKLDGRFMLTRVLFESRGEYFGLDRLRPAYHLLYTNNLSLESSKFEIQAELAYLPDIQTPLVVLFQAAYYVDSRNGVASSEGNLSLDTAFWLDRETNFTLTGELYLKKSSIYVVGGLQLEKTFANIIGLSGAGYLVIDGGGNLFNRYIVELGISPIPDTQIYAGYGWGNLTESFIGNLQKDGFYFGVRVKFDDSWFFKKDNMGKMSLSFFRDVNLNQRADSGDKPVPVRVKIGDKEYESDEMGNIDVSLPAGLYSVELIEFPGGLISLVEEPIQLSVMEYGVREFSWPFMESPSYIEISVFIDSNTSGKFENGEEYLDSFSVSMGEDSIFTTTGTLTLPVSPGEIKLSLDLSSFGEGVSLTTGAVDVELTLKAGEKKGIQFGIAFERRMEVLIFNDLNGNGVRELEEPLLDASGVLIIGGRPFRVGSQTLLEGVPSGQSQTALNMDKGFERLYSRTTSIETIEVGEKGDTRLEIGFAQRSSLNISLIDQTGDYLYEVVSLSIDGIEFQVFGMIELVGLVFGEHSIEITNLPQGYIVSDYLRTIWLAPGKNGDLRISVEKE